MPPTSAHNQFIGECYAPRVSTPTPPVDAPVPEAVSAAPTPEEVLAGEARVGGSPRALAANGVILALSRAARSFLIYEPSNEAIRVFLENLRRTAHDFLEQHGELDLEVRPFELVHGGEVVYLDRDRERSVAFRLYRDGVRRLTLRPGLDWHELLKLLEVMSIRYVGIRQTEDDLVVLLWKAGFAHITFEAVEGFVADDADSEGRGGQAGATAMHVDAPPDFDLPVPVRPQMVRVTWREVPAPALEELLREDETQALPELAVRLCEELLAAVSTAPETIQFADILPHLVETREFLFSEGLLAGSVRLAYAAASATLRDPASDRACAEFLEGFVTAQALHRLLHTVSRDALDAPPELYALLDALPGDHLRSLVEVLGTEQGEASRRITRRLLERYVAKRGDDVLAMLGGAPTALACELLRVLRYTDMDRARRAAMELIERNDLEIQLELLHSLEPMPMSPETGQMLLRLAAAENEEVRHRALGQLGVRKWTGAFAPLVARLKKEAPMRLQDHEAEVLGETLAGVSPEEALVQFREWCKPKGFFGGVLPGIGRLQRAAVAGLVVLRGEEAESLIRAVAERAGSELQAYCTQAMVKRRRMARGGTP